MAFETVLSGPIVPTFLSAIPQDFMDGQGLRYRRMSEGRFLLCSTGLDCRDDGGRMPERDTTLDQVHG